MIGAKLFDQGKQADDHGPPADHHNAEDEDGANQEAKPLKQREDKSVGARLEALFRGKRRHHFGARLSDQVRNGDELISLFA